MKKSVLIFFLVLKSAASFAEDLQKAVDLLKTGRYVLVENLPDVVKRVAPGVVNISSTTITHFQDIGMDEFFRFWGIPQERKQTSLGSGVIIDKEGYVVTNAHVVQNADEVMVTLNDKRQFSAKIIGKDEKMDLAVLQIRDDQKQVPSGLCPDRLGDSDQVETGAMVIAVGNPFGLQHTVTKGIISAKNRTIGLGPFDNFLQTDASINPGNSGGPLFDAQGDVIGINTAIHSQTGQSSGLGFAIPSNEVKLVIPDLKRYGYVPRPWLGIMIEPMTRQLARYHHLEYRSGALIYNLVRGSAAWSAQLKLGDIIMKVNSIEVADSNDVQKALRSCHPGDKVSFLVYRGRQSVQVEVTLGSAKKDIWSMPKGII
jgi:serine protease Do